MTSAGLGLGWDGERAACGEQNTGEDSPSSRSRIRECDTGGCAKTTGCSGCAKTTGCMGELTPLAELGETPKALAAGRVL